MISKVQGVMRGFLALVATTTLLAACGGNDNGGGSGTGVVTPPVTSMVPASASATAAGFITYLQQLIASFADTLEPVDTSSVTGPTDDTSEPTKID